MNYLGFEKQLLVLSIAFSSSLWGSSSAFAFVSTLPSASLTQEALSAVQSDHSVKSLLGNGSISTLHPSQRVSETELSTIKFQHYYHGIEVIGSMVYHQVGKAGAKVVNRLADFDLDVQPALSETQAIEIALSATNGSRVKSPPRLKILPEAVGDSAQLIYEVDIETMGGLGSRQVTIDAHSGALIANLSKQIAIAPTQIYSADHIGLDIETLGGRTPKTATGCDAVDLASGNIEKSLTAAECNNLDGEKDLLATTKCQFTINGIPQKYDVSTCPLADAGADASATRAERNSQAVLNYYQTHQNRNSFDDNGSPLISIVHAGARFANALWDQDGKFMFYGDGDGEKTGDFTQGLDIAGHEMTHGVTDATARLTMMGESGAINEANSDFFGIIIASQATSGETDWKIGKEVFLHPGPQSAIRDLANPGNISFCIAGSNGQCTDLRPDPDKISEMMPIPAPGAVTCDDSNDNCWIHFNATILGHAAYLVSQAITPKLAERLYYLTLTQSLSARDNLVTAAKAYKQTCAQVYDKNTCSQVTAAFAQVGL
ncbi:MAG: M4 family metallopeptidase [Oligoflexia bacterium]|nr:M4 family metallopeptidase [Oligoflexia bacterium]